MTDPKTTATQPSSLTSPAHTDRSRDRVALILDGHNISRPRPTANTPHETYVYAAQPDKLRVVTAPNQEFPPGAYGPSTVASLQTVTQTSVGQQQSADTRALLAQVQTTFIGNLLGGFGNVLDGIGSAINELISDLVYALKGITGGFH